MEDETASAGEERTPAGDSPATKSGREGAAGNGEGSPRDPLERPARDRLDRRPRHHHQRPVSPHHQLPAERNLAREAGQAEALERQVDDLALALGHAEAALRQETVQREEAEAALAIEWTDLERLQRIGTRLTGAEGFGPLLEEILDAAITIMGADMGNVQLLHPDTRMLRIATHRGFHEPFLEYFARVDPSTHSACGNALGRENRLIEPDVEHGDIFMENSRRVMLEAGARAVQSTPLVTRGGQVLGMLSTHWERPHEPSERELRYLDLLARQAADLIERARTEEELREANRRLRAQRERRENFLATLGHELRNPLGALDAALRVLRTVDMGRERLEHIMASQVSQLTRLVDDLLEVSRLTRGKVELRPERIDLVAAAKDACEGVRPSLDAKRQRLEVTAPDSFWVVADPARIRQIMTNLLDNAVKYSPEESRIRFRVERQGDEALVAVSDEGIGIPAHVLDSVFEPFVQANPGSGGLGIGLSLAHALAELHGGTLSARSEGRGRGAKLAFRMPVVGQDGPEEEETADAHQGVRLDGLRVLIVDDVEDAADLMAMLLSRRGCEVETAYGAKEALRKARNGRYDAVLLDLALPDGNGFEVAEIIRRGDKSVTLLALTGFGDDETHYRVAEAGFAARLLKPVDPNELCRLLHSQLRGTEAG